MTDKEKLERKRARMQETKERRAAAAAPFDETDPPVTATTHEHLLK